YGLRPSEAHRDEYEVGLNEMLGARNWLPSAHRKAGLRDAQGAHVAGLVADTRDGRREVASLSALFMRTRHLKKVWVHRPGLICGAACRRTPADRKIRHRRSTLPMRRSDAVGSGIAAADHDDVLARRRERRRHC